MKASKIISIELNKAVQIKLPDNTKLLAIFASVDILPLRKDAQIGLVLVDRVNDLKMFNEGKMFIEGRKSIILGSVFDLILPNKETIEVIVNSIDILPRRGDASINMTLLNPSNIFYSYTSGTFGLNLI